MKSREFPQVSVVVVNWNRREYLRECLLSLVTQAGVNLEVIVVDNGSTDGSTQMVLREFVDPGRILCRLIANPDNRGFCAANNQGIHLAGSGLIALLNNDAVAEPGWLEAMAAILRERPDVGMIASKVLVHEDRRKIDKAGHLIYPDGQNRGRGSGEWDNGQYDTVEDVAWPDGCAAMYRKSMLDQIGGFDEDFFAYGDDAELGLRARIAGWNCLYVPGAVVYHRRGATLGLGSGRRLELIERNRVLLAAKLFPWSLLLLNGYYYGLRLLAGLYAAVRGRGEANRYPGWKGKLVMAGSLLKGDLSALRMLPRILAKRREIERFQKLSPTEIRALLNRYRIPLRTLTQQAI